MRSVLNDPRVYGTVRALLIGKDIVEMGAAG
jgi:hypothetical protein